MSRCEYKVPYTLPIEGHVTEIEPHWLEPLERGKALVEEKEEKEHGETIKGPPPGGA